MSFAAIIDASKGPSHHADAFRIGSTAVMLITLCYVAGPFCKARVPR